MSRVRFVFKWRKHLFSCWLNWLTLFIHDLSILILVHSNYYPSNLLLHLFLKANVNLINNNRSSRSRTDSLTRKVHELLIYKVKTRVDEQQKLNWIFKKCSNTNHIGQHSTMKLVIPVWSVIIFKKKCNWNARCQLCITIWRCVLLTFIWLTNSKVAKQCWTIFE